MNTIQKFTLLSLSFLSLPVASLSIASPDTGFISLFDQNNDDKLTLQEFLAIQREPNIKLTWNFPISPDSFKTLDRNGDNYLDKKDNLPISYTEDFYKVIQCWPSKC